MGNPILTIPFRWCRSAGFGSLHFRCQRLCQSFDMEDDNGWNVTGPGWISPTVR